MSRKFFTAILIIVSAFLFCCSPSLLLPTTSDVAVAKKHWSDADSLSLREGYNLYVNKCGACHTLHRPSRYDENKWRKEIPLMKDSAKISDAQVELILRYVLTKRETTTLKKN